MQNTETRKITLHLPSRLLENAQAASGLNLTDTIKEALRLFAARRAGEALIEMSGKIPVDIDLDALRNDE